MIFKEFKKFINNLDENTIDEIVILNNESGHYYDFNLDSDYDGNLYFDLILKENSNYILN